MTDKHVYRTAAADVIAEREAFNNEYIEWSASIKSLVASWYPDTDARPAVYDQFGHLEFRGVDGLPWKHPLPEGFRRDPKLGIVVPFKSRKAGKEIVKQMAALSAPVHLRRRLRGMPAYVLGGHHGLMCQPGIERHGAHVYVVWSTLLDPETEYDPTVWEAVRLSEYYAAREAETVDA